MPLPNVPTAAAGGKVTATWANAVKESLAYLDAQAGGIGRRNALTNSHFDVWQRGTSFAVASSTKTYTADRWYAYRTATGATISRQAGPTGQAYKLRVQRDNGNSSTAGITVGQAVETVNSVKLAGRTCQLKFTAAAGANFSAASAQIRVKVTTGTGTDESPTGGFTGSSDVLDEYVTLSATAADFEFSFDVADTTKQVMVTFTHTPVGTAGAADYADIAAVQLAAGSTSDYERLPVSDTRGECDRYCQVVAPAGVGVTSATTSVYRWTLPLRTAMRATPTVTITGATLYDGTVSRAYSAIGGEYHSAAVLQADLTVSGGNFTAVGRAAIMYDSGSGSITAEAEL